MRPIAAEVAWSVCLSVCLLDTTVNPTKRLNQSRCRFGIWTRVGPDRGGATVLKVGGTDSASGASRKFFFEPPTFWPVGGTKYCLHR